MTSPTRTSRGAGQYALLWAALACLGLAQLSAGSAVAAPAAAQQGVGVIEQSHSYLFNNSFTFRVEFEAELPIMNAYVFYQWPGGGRSWVYEGELLENRILDVQVALDESNQPPPFSEVEYWYRFADVRGQVHESATYSFYYDDNRYEWSSHQDGPFTLYWYAGDAGYAAAILAAARQGVQRIQALLPGARLSEATLRVYEDAADVQLIAGRSGISWQAGHSDPAAGLLLLALPPGAGQSLEIQRQVPHEVAHLMLYQSLGATQYARLPAWLNEGIAAQAELYSDPEAAALLAAAAADSGLLPLAALCAAFPQDAASARLAYAQAASFVGYLFEQYGQVGFGLLVDAYLQGSDCLAAPQQDFGMDLNGLQAEWAAALFEPKPQGAAAWLAAVPWQTILASAGAALVLFLVLRLSGRR
ncbi:MAG: hypothetical protein KIS85_02005 [Anaerolineales bacterium]|nr:hypothetical protein [Anaerolineales bacterium]